MGITNGRYEFKKELYPIKRYINAIQHNKNRETRSGSKANARATILLSSVPGNKIYYTADNANAPFKIIYARVLIREKNKIINKRYRF